MLKMLQSGDRCLLGSEGKHAIDDARQISVHGSWASPGFIGIDGPIAVGKSFISLFPTMPRLLPLSFSRRRSYLPPFLLMELPLHKSPSDVIFG
jgi:hypothetical protein